MEIDVILLLRFLVLGSLAILLPIILVKLIKVLTTLQKTLENIEYLSDLSKDGLETNDDLKNMVSDIGSQTINKTVNSQARTISDNISNIIYNLISNKGR